MSKFEEVVKKNDGYFVGGKVGVRNKLFLHPVAGKRYWITLQKLMHVESWLGD
jgi:hypothetical protein